MRLTPDHIDSLCEHLSSGNLSLRDWCDADPLRPRLPSVASALRRNDAAGQRLRDARAAGCDVMAADCLAIVDAARHAPAAEAAARASAARAAVDLRLKLAGAWDRENYGERQRHDIGGSGVPITMSLQDTALRVQQIIAIATARPEEPPAQVLSVTEGTSAALPAPARVLDDAEFFG